MESIEHKWTYSYFPEAYQHWEPVLEYWVKHGTWLKQPWVLEVRNFDGGSLHSDVKSPYMLIEGHSRLGILRLFAKENQAASQHTLWVVRGS